MDVNLLFSFISAIACSISLVYIVRTQRGIWDIQKETKRLQALRQESLEQIKPISINKLSIPKKFLKDLLKGKVVEVHNKEYESPIKLKFKKMDFNYVANIVESIRQQKRKLKEKENE